MSNLMKTKINRSHREGILQQFLYSDDKGIGLDRVRLIRNTSQTSGKLPTVLGDPAAGTRNLVTQLKFFFNVYFKPITISCIHGTPMCIILCL